jgi:hypothetical protein
MHAQGPSCAGRTVGVELRVVQSLRLGPRSGPWVSGHYCKQPAYDDRIIDLAIRKDCGCNSVLAALEVKRKSEVAAMRLLSGQKTEDQDRTVSASVVSGTQALLPVPACHPIQSSRSRAHHSQGWGECSLVDLT